ncbi:MAG: hypothetical protein JWO31_184 [Phycisphaerales bacterium]|nr:hypothetical protein [Phycisphaerales bacterium]
MAGCYGVVAPRPIPHRYSLLAGRASVIRFVCGS